MTGEAVKQRVREYMRSWEMTEPGDGLLAGVSGGADSVCLLFLLDELKEELGIRLAAFHLNHGLRGAEADRDEAYVKEICGRLGIPLAVAHENVAEYAAARGISGEEAGRILRYEHMKETAEQFSCQKTATAHHRDDSAETVLFNMFRGSGLKGLSGIRPVRGEVIRPLLCLSRAEIAGYLEERGIPWCEDSTNGENVYTRNRIRNQLLPWVKENINARAPEHILAAAELAAQADAYFAELAEKLLADAGDLERLPEDAGDVSEALAVSIPTEIFDRQPPVVQGYLVRAMVSRAAGSPRDISAKHVEAVRALTGPGEERRRSFHTGSGPCGAMTAWRWLQKNGFCPGRPEKGLWRHFPLRPGCFLIKKEWKFPKTSIRNGLIMIESKVRYPSGPGKAVIIS